MRGSKCKCGFSTISMRKVCPRCGRIMEEAEWPNEGRVLSFTKLDAVPEGLKERYNLALVGIDKGPRLVCWSKSTLNDNEVVTISDVSGKYFCNPVDLSFKLEEQNLKA